MLKPGYKTTEFLITLLTDVGLIVSAAAGVLPHRYAAIGAVVAQAAYAIARGLAKLSPPVVAPPAAPPTASP